MVRQMMALAAVCAALMTAMPVATAGTIVPGEYKVVSGRSVAGFEVKGVPGKVRGKMRMTDGTLSFGPGLRSLSGEITLDARSLRVGNKTAARSMRGRDGFFVERHPKIRFVVTDFQMVGDSVNVTGDLTVKGVTRPITLSGEVLDAKRNRIVLQMTGTLDRTKFGITAGRPLYSRKAQLSLGVTARK